MSLNIIDEDNKHCTPCKTKDKKVESQYYCTDCEAYYCEDCFELHPRVPYLAKHIVLKHDDIVVWSKLQYKCSTHDKNLEFFCGTHKVLCCHVCVSLTHRSCDGMEYILESAKNICAKDEIKLMLQRTQSEIEKIQTYEEAFETKAATNIKSKSEYINKLEEYATKLKEMIDLRKTRALFKMTENFKDNARYSEETFMEMKKFKNDLQDLEKQLTTATSEKEVLIFISLKRGENIIEDIEGKLSKLDISTRKENFKPKIKSKFEDYLNDIESLAVLEDEQMMQELVSSEDLNDVIKICDANELMKETQPDQYQYKKDVRRECPPTNLEKSKDWGSSISEQNSSNKATKTEYRAVIKSTWKDPIPPTEKDNEIGYKSIELKGNRVIGFNSMEFESRDKYQFQGEENKHSNNESSSGYKEPFGKSNRKYLDKKECNSMIGFNSMEFESRDKYQFQGEEKKHSYKESSSGYKDPHEKSNRKYASRKKKVAE